MNRRDLLRAAAAAPWIFGLGCSRSPSWFGEALGKIRDGKPGLVLRLPADPQLRCQYGHSLWWLMEDTEASSVAISRQALFICLEDEGVRSLLSGAREGESLLLIDGQGVVLDGRPLEGPAGLAGAAMELLDGPKRERLRARAATNELSRRVLESRETADRELEDQIEALGQGTPAPLPYGASIELGRSTCAEDPNCRNGTCVACGMALVTGPSREFVKFLAR